MVEALSFVDQIRVLKGKGLSQKQAAEKLSVTTRTIINRLNAAGLRWRDVDPMVIEYKVKASEKVKISGSTSAKTGSGGGSQIRKAGADMAELSEDALQQRIVDIFNHGNPTVDQEIRLINLGISLLDKKDAFKRENDEGLQMAPEEVRALMGEEEHVSPS